MNESTRKHEPNGGERRELIPLAQVPKGRELQQEAGFKGCLLLSRGLIRKHLEGVRDDIREGRLWDILHMFMMRTGLGFERGGVLVYPLYIGSKRVAVAVERCEGGHALILPEESASLGMTSPECLRLLGSMHDASLADPLGRVLEVMATGYGEHRIQFSAQEVRPGEYELRLGDGESGDDEDAPSASMDGSPV